MTRFTNSVRCSLAARHAAAAALLAFGALVGTSRGETIADFGDLSLAPNTYWNGADNSGGFASGGAQFNNQFFSGYGTTWWGGWSYSNVNNTTTSDYTNQYGAVAGTGLGSSGIYAVGYVDAYDGVLPTITIPTGMQVQSAMLTNTTYAFFSMLDGDNGTKQFTDTDWFDLTISGLDANNQPVGTPVNFYLATGWQHRRRLDAGRLEQPGSSQDVGVQPDFDGQRPLWHEHARLLCPGQPDVGGRAGAFDVCAARRRRRCRDVLGPSAATVAANGGSPRRQPALKSAAVCKAPSFT